MGLEVFDLTGKVILVTGASRGLGRAMAIGLAEAGADLVLTARSAPDLEEAAAEVRRQGRQALAVKADVSVPGDVEAMVRAAMDRFGRVDALVNNSGIAGEKPLLDMTEGDWDAVLDTNLKGTFLCSKAVGAHMVARGQGKIINIASVAGYIGTANLSAYCASKGGVIQFTKALALEWARYNVQVNAICPGYFRTSMNAGFFETEKGREYIKRWIPLRRVGEPSELQGAVIFLASGASGFMTGSALVIDGGQTAW